MRCYQCEKETDIVFYDNRCKSCTRYKIQLRKHGTQKSIKYRLSLGSEISFGKYKGRVFDENFIKTHRNYLLWLTKEGIALMNDECHSMLPMFENRTRQHRSFDNYTDNLSDEDMTMEYDWGLVQ